MPDLYIPGKMCCVQIDYAALAGPVRSHEPDYGHQKYIRPSRAAVDDAMGIQIIYLIIRSVNTLQCVCVCFFFILRRMDKNQA